MESAWKYSIRNLFNKNRYKLKIELTHHGLGFRKYDQKMEITEESEAKLMSCGFKPAYKFIDDLSYFSIPVYMKLNNWKQYVIKEDDPQDTASTLGDFARSNTTKTFKKGLTRKAMLSGMDGKMLAVIVIVVIVVAGCVFLFMR